MRIACTGCGRMADHLGPARTGEPELTPLCQTCDPYGFAPLPRVGPAMIDACLALSTAPGRTKREVARMIAPHGDEGAGYAAIDRAIRAGMILAVKVGARYALSLTSLGERIAPWRPVAR